jgi:pilus assembly protein CpaE
MRVVIALEDFGRRDYFRQVALSLGLECELLDCVTPADLRVRLAQGPVDLVLVVLDRDAASGLAAIRSAASQCGVLATGPQDAQLVMQAIRSGARSYLDQKSLREELSSALVQSGTGSDKAHYRGRLLAVVSACPGSGVTTIASSLAFAWGEVHPQRVALAELGVGVPELSLTLDLKPRHSVADLADQWQRLDAAMMSQTVVPHAAGVHVLAHKPETLLAHPLNAQAMQHTLLLLKSMYDYVVLDLGHLADGPVFDALGLAEQVLVVMRLDVPSLRLTRRYLNDLIERGLPADRFRIVANRYGQRKQLGWKDAEKALGLPILEYIPDDPSTLNAALNSGTPLIRTARRASITKSFDKLASRLNGRA